MELQQRKGELQGQLSLLNDDQAVAEAREAEAYRQLLDARRSSNQQFLDFVNGCQTLAGFRAAQQLLSVRDGEDALTLSNVVNDTAALKQSVLEAVNMHQTAREQARRELSMRGREWANYEREAHAQRAETLRLQQERMELELRSDAASLKHARELFGVQ